MTSTNQLDIESSMRSVLQSSTDKLNIGQLTHIITAMKHSSSTSEFRLFDALIRKIRTHPSMANTLINPKFIRSKSVIDFKLTMIVNSEKLMDDPYMCFVLLKSFIRKDYYHIDTRKLTPLINILLRRGFAFLDLLIEVLKDGSVSPTNSLVYCLINMDAKMFGYLSSEVRNLLLNTFEEYIRERIWSPKQLLPRFGVQIFKAAEFFKLFRDDLVISEYLKRYIDQYEVCLIDKKSDDAGDYCFDKLSSTDDIIEFVNAVKNKKVKSLILKTLYRNVTRYLLHRLIAVKPDAKIAITFTNALQLLMHHISFDGETRRIMSGFAHVLNIMHYSGTPENLFSTFMDSATVEERSQPKGIKYVNNIIKGIQKRQGTASYATFTEFFHFIPEELHVLKQYLLVYTVALSTSNSDYNELVSSLSDFMAEYKDYMHSNTQSDIKCLIAIFGLIINVCRTDIYDSTKSSLAVSFLSQNVDVIFASPKELVSLYLLILVYKHQVNDLAMILSQPISVIVPTSLYRTKTSVHTSILCHYDSGSRDLRVSVTKSGRIYDGKEFIVSVRPLSNEDTGEISRQNIALYIDKTVTTSFVIPDGISALQVSLLMSLPQQQILIKQTFVSI